MIILYIYKNKPRILFLKQFNIEKEWNEIKKTIRKIKVPQIKKQTY